MIRYRPKNEHTEGVKLDHDRDSSRTRAPMGGAANPYGASRRRAGGHSHTYDPRTVRWTEGEGGGQP